MDMLKPQRPKSHEYWLKSMPPGTDILFHVKNNDNDLKNLRFIH